MRRVSVDKLVPPGMLALKETDTVFAAQQLMDAHGLEVPHSLTHRHDDRLGHHEPL